MTDLKVVQSEQYQGDDWWKWSVWIEGPGPTLDQVVSVTYRLHPTFPQPVRVVDDRPSNFRLETSGWGGFTIHASVKFQGGSKLELKHELELHYPSGKPTTA